MENKFSDFEKELNTDLAVSVATVADAAEAKLLTAAHLAALLHPLVDFYPNIFAKASNLTDSASDDPGYGADFNLSDEVNSQIRVVRSLRNMIMDQETGAIKEGHSARDAKELISSSNTMLASLMKFHDKIINQDRIRAVEQATIEAVKDLPQESQDRFFDRLEAALESVK